MTKKEFYKRNKFIKGFTLIEVVVVMAVFLFIIGAAIGIFLSVVTNQKRILTEQQVINQISYASEYMSKAIRMAKIDKTGTCLIDAQNNKYINGIYLLTGWNVNAYTGIKFVNSDNICQMFYLGADGILYEKKLTGTAPQVPIISLTDMQIKSMKFVIDGYSDVSYFVATGGNNTQPRITMLFEILLKGESFNNATKIIQTTVSRRTLNTPQ